MIYLRSQQQKSNGEKTATIISQSDAGSTQKSTKLSLQSYGSSFYQSQHA